MLWKIFLGALAIRWIYAVLMFALMGDAGLQSVDSGTYLSYAHEYSAAIAAGSLHRLQWLGPVSDTMPLAHWLFTLSALVPGTSASLVYVLLQGLFDAGTCLIVYRLAQTVDEAYAAPAAIAAALNPTQIVLSGLALTDTPFVFFCALFLFAAVQWLRSPTWCWAVAIGVALGAATMTRVLAAPFAAVLIVFLLATCAARKLISRRRIAQLVAAAVIFCFCIAPAVWRNVREFGAWSLTPQSGIHFALWIVPWIEQAANGTPWTAGNQDMQRRFDERYPTPAADPFEQSRRYETVGREQLAPLGIRPIAKAWAIGAAINLGSPAIILSPPILQLPHTGFYATHGARPADKIENFLFHSDNAIYAWILLAGIAGVMLVRLIQIVGLVALLRHGGALPLLCLFGLWTAYVLAVDGPVASPKYRLPIEPPLMVLTGAGLSELLRRKPA
jgi:4-amino-4-deoxy-L-arabinose transferase-like glycosyltransferase